MEMTEEIKEIFSNLPRGRSYKMIAESGGISRPTLYKAQKNPSGMTLRVLRKVMAAVGYNIKISFEKKGLNQVDTQLCQHDSTISKPGIWVCADCGQRVSAPDWVKNE